MSSAEADTMKSPQIPHRTKAHCSGIECTWDIDDSHGGASPFHSEIQPVTVRWPLLTSDPELHQSSEQPVRAVRTNLDTQSPFCDTNHDTRRRRVRIT